MTHRITRKQLERRVQLLNEVEGRPLAGWTKDSEGRYRSNEGHYHLEAYAPGDGWTRYSLVVYVGEGGGISHVGTARGFTLREMDAYLSGYVAGRFSTTDQGRYDPA